MAERQENQRPAPPAHSPTPWRVTTNRRGYENFIVDANGLPVADCWGGEGKYSISSVERAKADAELICEAVNAHGEVERLLKDYAEMNSIAANLQRSRAKIIEDNDHLRELVRRMGDEMDDMKNCLIIVSAIAGTTRDADGEARVCALLAEARAAIGEEAGDA